MADNGDGSKKIWITEFGCPSDGATNDCTDAIQATQITDAYQQARSSSYDTFLGPLFIFDWWDNTTDGDYGLFTSSGVAKPALAAYEAAAK
jgi:exo-beta-1,3-glucanase (GH17 family)